MLQDRIVNKKCRECGISFNWKSINGCCSSHCNGTSGVNTTEFNKSNWKIFWYYRSQCKRPIDKNEESIYNSCYNDLYKRKYKTNY